MLKSDYPILNRRPDGKIGDGVYISYDWSVATDGSRKLCRIYISTSSAGPILQYDVDGDNRWDGYKTRYFPRGAWTPVYSRGDYGHNFYTGGHWSGHTLSLIGVPDKPKIDYGQKILLGDQLCSPPDGIKGDIQLMEIPVEGSWAIWYATARDAMRSRLARQHIQQADLPHSTKKHLEKNETQEVIARVWEVIDSYKI